MGSEEKREKIVAWSIILLVLGACYCYLNGLHFTAQGAIKGNGVVNDSSILLEKIESRNIQIHFFENEDQYDTVIANYKFPFWRSNVSTYISKHDVDDTINVIGACSFYDKKGGATALGFQVDDEKVKYIVVEADGEEQKQVVSLNHIIVFYWEKAVTIDNLSGRAYSKDEEILYQLESRVVNSKQKLNWYPVKEEYSNINE